jgi:hypothetical protein
MIVIVSYNWDSNVYLYVGMIKGKQYFKCALNKGLMVKRSDVRPLFSSKDY